MVSGLYDLPGFSATATAAAWANRFELPMTKVSKVYFGFSRRSSRRAGRGSRPWSGKPRRLGGPSSEGSDRKSDR